jgi:hypothetical protein
MGNKTTILLVSFVVLVLAVASAFVIGSGGKSGSAGVCAGKSGSTTKINIHDSKVSNPNITGNLCDKIMFTNSDPITREIAFGAHENHVPYDGVAEKFLNKGQSFTITLDQTGKFHWHDHIHDEVEGYFTVTQ